MDETYLAALQIAGLAELVELPPVKQRPAAGLVFDISFAV